MYIIFKICGMILLFVCATSVGISMAHALSDRVHALESSLAVLGGLETELSYSLAPPDEVVTRLDGREAFSSAAFLPACASSCRIGMPFPQAWRKAVNEHRGCLTSEDAGLIASLADVLGQCDLEGQLTAISHIRELLQVQLDGARRYCETHAKLYRTMGMLCGAFFIIFFI